MKQTDASYVTVGKVGSTHGIKGWLKIHSYTEFGASILDYSPWYLSMDSIEWHPVTIEESHIQDDSILIKLPHIDTPEAARRYTNSFIAIQRSQLPILPQGDYYWSDLIGLTVTNQRGESLGTVLYLMETGSNDVLVVKGVKEHAIPYLPGRVILNVDLEKREILVDWEII